MKRKLNENNVITNANIEALDNNLQNNGEEMLEKQKILTLMCATDMIKDFNDEMFFHNNKAYAFNIFDPESMKPEKREIHIDELSRESQKNILDKLSPEDRKELIDKRILIGKKPNIIKNLEAENIPKTQRIPFKNILLENKTPDIKLTNFIKSIIPYPYNFSEEELKLKTSDNPLDNKLFKLYNIDTMVEKLRTETPFILEDYSTFFEHEQGYNDILDIKATVRYIRLNQNSKYYKALKDSKKEEFAELEEKIKKINKDLDTFHFFLQHQGNHNPKIIPIVQDINSISFSDYKNDIIDKESKFHYISNLEMLHDPSKKSTKKSFTDKYKELKSRDSFEFLEDPLNKITYHAYYKKEFINEPRFFSNNDITLELLDPSHQTLTITLENSIDGFKQEYFSEEPTTDHFAWNARLIAETFAKNYDPTTMTDEKYKLFSRLFEIKRSGDQLVALSTLRYPSYPKVNLLTHDKNCILYALLNEVDTIFNYKQSMIKSNLLCYDYLFQFQFYILSEKYNLEEKYESYYAELRERCTQNIDFDYSRISELEDSIKSTYNAEIAKEKQTPKNSINTTVTKRSKKGGGLLLGGKSKNLTQRTLKLYKHKPYMKQQPFHKSKEMSILITKENMNSISNILSYIYTIGLYDLEPSASKIFSKYKISQKDEVSEDDLDAITMKLSSIYSTDEIISIVKALKTNLNQTSDDIVIGGVRYYLCSDEFYHNDTYLESFLEKYHPQLVPDESLDLHDRLLHFRSSYTRIIQRIIKQFIENYPTKYSRKTKKHIKKYKKTVTKTKRRN